MNLIEVLRHRACDPGLAEPDIAIDTALQVLANLSQAYRIGGERMLVQEINDLTVAAFAYVPRKVPMPEPLVVGPGVLA